MELLRLELAQVAAEGDRALQSTSTILALAHRKLEDARTAIRESEESPTASCYCKGLRRTHRARARGLFTTTAGRDW